MTWTDEDIIKATREGRDDGLVYLYQQTRKEFEKWVRRRYHVDAHQGLDAFQDAILALRSNISRGRVDDIKSSLKTYLFAIGRNQLLNRLKKQGKEYSSEELSTVENTVTTSYEKQELSERQEKIRDLVRRMGEPCHTILKMFYYLGYSMSVISVRLEYKSEDVAKTVKSRCIKKIRTLVEES